LGHFILRNPVEGYTDKPQDGSGGSLGQQAKVQRWFRYALGALGFLNLVAIGH
jgi:hypothetical protein